MNTKKPWCRIEQKYVEFFGGSTTGYKETKCSNDGI